MSSSIGDAAVDRLELACYSTSPKPRVACAIITYHGAREDLVETYLSWGKHCYSFLPFSDEEWTDENNLVKTIPLRIGISDYEGHWQSVQRICTYLADELEAGTLSFDYVTISGDD